jgi:hypothetical protein
MARLASGYDAFTLANDGKDDLIEYIKSQEEHHRRVSFLEEYKALPERAGVDHDPRYLA